MTTRWSCARETWCTLWKSVTTDGLWEHHSVLESLELSQEIMSLKSSCLRKFLAALYKVIVDILCHF